MQFFLQRQKKNINKNHKNTYAYAKKSGMVWYGATQFFEFLQKGDNLSFVKITQFAESAPKTCLICPQPDANNYDKIKEIVAKYANTPTMYTCNNYLVMYMSQYSFLFNKIFCHESI